MPICRYRVRLITLQYVLQRPLYLYTFATIEQNETEKQNEKNSIITICTLLLHGIISAEQASRT